MSQRTLVLHPVLPTDAKARRDPQFRLEEAIGLAHAIDLDVVDSVLAQVRSPRPSTLLGSGKIDEIGLLVKAEEISLIVVDSQLSPVQQRNLENAWSCKVIDRTALILEIFGERARTREGQLQVELASLEYQKSRLVRSWTHLERQRGGFGFMGGPGESQIETDRRLIRDRIAKIRRELTTITRTRELHRKVRREVPYPLVALVGYTNAGKSTLFNRLTGSDVVAVDKLFATLDPTIRKLTLPSGFQIMLSDTVGFVSDLPHELVAAFRATLEEVIEADLILHVRDIAHPESDEQKKDVEDVLSNLFKQDDPPENMIEVWNKIDLLAEEEKAMLSDRRRAMPISALTGEGIDTLLAALESYLSSRFHQLAVFTLDVADGKARAWLHEHGQIIKEKTDDGQTVLTVRISPQNIARFEKLFRKTSPAKKKS